MTLTTQISSMEKWKQSSDSTNILDNRIWKEVKEMHLYLEECRAQHSTKEIKGLTSVFELVKKLI